MDVSKVAKLEMIATSEFLLKDDFGKEMVQASHSEVCDFRNRCREFVDVNVLLAQHVLSADFFYGIYCFCPELLLEGNDQRVFQLFSRLTRMFERSGFVPAASVRSGIEEFTTFVVDIRKQHAESELSAEDIDVVVSFLFADYSFMSRKRLVEIFKLCCLIVEQPSLVLPENIIELDNCAVPPAVVTSCLKGVQSLVSSASYKQGAFFTEGTMENDRDFIACSRQFMSFPAFDPWDGIARTDRTEFFTRHTAAFDVYLARKNKESEEGLYGANRSPCFVRFATTSGSSTSGSGTLPRTLFPKTSFGFASAKAVSTDCGCPSSSKGEKKSSGMTLSSLLNPGKFDESVKMDTSETLRRSGREAVMSSDRASSNSSVTSGKSSGKGGGS